VLLGGKGRGEDLGSLLNRAVHIATPAPPPALSRGCWRGRREETELSNER